MEIEETIRQEDTALRFKLFGMEIIFARRRRVEGESRIQFDINKCFFAKLFARIKNWVRRLFGMEEEPIEEENKLITYTETIAEKEFKTENELSEEVLQI